MSDEHSFEVFIGLSAHKLNARKMNMGVRIINKNTKNYKVYIHTNILNDKKYIGKFFTFCIEKGHKGGEKLKEKAGRGLFVALLLFVGIPLPGTGAWTGTLAASFLDMGFKKSVIAVLLGVLLAGVIMGIASAGVFTAIFSFA